MINTIFHSAASRGQADHGWLKARHSFSFAGYHDPARIQYGALRVLNDDIIAPGTGFGKHAHDNMEIITIVLDGTLEHQDSMGHTQIIKVGEVQVMSAGSGVTHSEYNQSKDAEVNLLQTWIFPDKKNVTPRYDQAFFDEKERTNKWQTLVSPIDKDGPGMKIHQNAWISRAVMDAGRKLHYTFHKPGNGAYIFLIKGNVVCDKHNLRKRDALSVNGTIKFELSALMNTDLLVFEVPM